MHKSAACVRSFFTRPRRPLKGLPLTLVHGHHRLRCLFRVEKRSSFEASLYQNVETCEFLSDSPVSFSAGKPLAPTSLMGKVSFRKRCQDFCLMAKTLCRQTDASVHVLSIPHVQTFLSGSLSASLSLSLSLMHTCTYTHARTHIHTNTGGCFLIIHTEKCPVRTSLSCKPDSAGCSVITTPAVYHPISLALCCVCLCVCVCVSVCVGPWICMIFPSDLKPQSTDSIYFPDKTKDTNNSYKNEGGKKGRYLFI